MNGVALPPDIGELCEGRNKAIQLWAELRDHYHAQRELAASLCFGGSPSLSAGYSRGYDQSGEFTSAFLEKDREKFLKLATAEIDRRCWHGLLERTGFDALLDRQAREEFEASIKGEPPEFTIENCRATFGHIWGNRRELYLRGVANVFMAMDRRFRSHDAFAIGNRLILENALHAEAFLSGWRSHNRRDSLRDVERVFRELDGLGPLGYSDGIAQQIEDAQRNEDLPHVVEGDYFRVRVFKNGNLHLWFKRKDLLDQINSLLLEYYKPIEGEVAEEGPSYESGPLFHATPAKRYGEFFTSDEVADIVADRADIYPGCSVLEPSAGRGALAKAAKARGATVICVEIQAGLAYELSRAGFETSERDFLKLGPASWPKFDRILMNPPFDRGRDVDHVRHAWRFLRPGGTLVSIMSARAEHCEDARHKPLRELIRLCYGSERERWAWRDLPEKSFAHAGTNVNTVVLKLEKPRQTA